MSGRNCKLIVVKPEKRGGYMPSQVMTSALKEASDATSQSTSGSTHREREAGLGRGYLDPRGACEGHARWGCPINSAP